MRVATLIASTCCVSAFAFAATIDVPRLAPAVHADREVSSDTDLSRRAVSDERVFKLHLSFASSPSNNVQVAFGSDADPADGALAAEETAFIIGWDCGGWFLRPRGLRVRYACTPADGQAARRRTLTAMIRSDARGVPRAVSFEDDAGPIIFDGLDTEPIPEWLVPADWTLLRVTVRGSDVAEEQVVARFLPDGATIILR